MPSRPRPGIPLQEAEVYAARLYAVRDQIESAYVLNPNPALEDAAATVTFIAHKLDKMSDPRES
jgi:hypothetical protein